MQIKIKLTDKETGFEISDLPITYLLADKVKELIKNDFPDFDCIIKVYGELIKCKGNYPLKDGD